MSRESFLYNIKCLVRDITIGLPALAYTRNPAGFECALCRQRRGHGSSLAGAAHLLLKLVALFVQEYLTGNLWIRTVHQQVG